MCNPGVGIFSLTVSTVQEYHLNSKLCSVNIKVPAHHILRRVFWEIAIAANTSPLIQIFIQLWCAKLFPYIKQTRCSRAFIPKLEEVGT